MPAEHVASVWGTVAAWGLEQMGDYGAFWYQMALSSAYFGKPYETPDDGTALLTALTKCDSSSWCAGLRDDHLTMTRESWHDGTYSHEWGASPIVGVAWGLLGVHQTAPAFATFTVKPKLGALDHASISVPTIRGPVNVTAHAAGALDVHVPCGALATLCLPRSARDSSSAAATALLLDGAAVPAVASGGHLCAGRAVSCGAAGAPRRLRRA